MLFNSIAFVIFFPVVIAGYFLLPSKFRNAFLLLSSCYFYMYFNPVYILILAYTIAVDFYAGIQIEKNIGDRSKQKKWLYASLVANLGALAFFKYATFILYNFSLVFHWSMPSSNSIFANIVLPIGLSFHTFQAISYTVEVYRGKQKAERNWLVYSLYVMFFPQLVAGPIERPQKLLHQFKEHHLFTYDNFSLGMKWILWGLFKKMVVADNLSTIVDAVYQHPQNYQGYALIIATILFAFQIYGDFSGYSDIARGAARVLGFDLMINFNMPYFSKSFSEFWRRWHISLSSWFKEYVYIPLGGNQKWFFRNVFITFALSGLWHGANHTFLVWGILNGLLVFANKYMNPWLAKLPAVLAIIITFIGIDFCWIFFRAANMQDAFYIIGNLFSNLHPSALLQIPVERHLWLVSGAMLCLMLGLEWFVKSSNLPVQWHTAKPVQRIVFLNFLLFILLFFGVFEHRTFIYFQF